MRRWAIWLSLVTAALIFCLHADAFADFLKPTQTDKEVSEWVGGSGGGFHRLMCPDEMPNMVGVSGRFGEWIDAIAPLCVATEASGRWRGQEALEPMDTRAGGFGGHEDSVVCPAGTFVLAWEAFTTRSQPDYVVGMKLWCGTPGPGAVATLWTPSAESAFNDALNVADVTCRNGIGVGLYVYSGSYVDRIALVCAPPRRGIGTIQQAGTAEPGKKLLITKQDSAKAGGAYQLMQGQKVVPAPSATVTDKHVLQSATAVAAAPDTPAVAPALPASRTYAPPLLKNGLHLYACETTADIVCKGPVADKFCKQQGYARAEHFDTGKEKGPAQTLGGQYCNSSRCRVFEEIVCVL
jgi:hypothetical protein